MSVFALLVGYIVYWAIYIVAFNLFGESGFMFYLGTFLSSVIGGYLGAFVAGKVGRKKCGTEENVFIPYLGIFTIVGCVIGIIRNGWGEIWEYLLVLLGLFIANGFFYMRLDRLDRYEKS